MHCNNLTYSQYSTIGLTQASKADIHFSKLVSNMCKIALAILSAFYAFPNGNISIPNLRVVKNIEIVFQ